MPACCDGCGAQSSLEYELDCKKGESRHNEVRDTLRDIVSLVYKNVLREERPMNQDIPQH